PLPVQPPGEGGDDSEHVPHQLRLRRPILRLPGIDDSDAEAAQKVLEQPGPEPRQPVRVLGQEPASVSHSRHHSQVTTDRLRDLVAENPKCLAFLEAQVGEAGLPARSQTAVLSSPPGNFPESFLVDGMTVEPAPLSQHSVAVAKEFAYEAAGCVHVLPV